MALQGSERNNLIEELARATGLEAQASKKMQKSHYDPMTGTWYCKGQVIAANEVTEAEDYFLEQYTKCNNSSDSYTKSLARRYLIAAEAIRMQTEAAKQAQKENDGK
ncbi:hypothetical protein SAMN05216390_101252 [Lachnospiraceae bacterium KH1T2]|nr:hypothetical protein SAMN05216390_101252 [Lachnospiraceae bacterium KH1T2]